MHLNTQIHTHANDARIPTSVQLHTHTPTNTHTHTPMMHAPPPQCTYIYKYLPTYLHTHTHPVPSLSTTNKPAVPQASVQKASVTSLTLRGTKRLTTTPTPSTRDKKPASSYCLFTGLALPTRYPGPRRPRTPLQAWGQRGTDRSIHVHTGHGLTKEL